MLQKKLKYHYRQLSQLKKLFFPSELKKIIYTKNAQEYSVYECFVKYKKHILSNSKDSFFSKDLLVQSCVFLYHNKRLTEDKYNHIKSFLNTKKNKAHVLNYLKIFKNKIVSQDTLDYIFGTINNNSNEQAHDFTKLKKYYNSLNFYQKQFFPKELKNAIFNEQMNKDNCYKIIFKYEANIHKFILPGFFAAYSSLQTDIYRFVNYYFLNIDDEENISVLFFDKLEKQNMIQSSHTKVKSTLSKLQKTIHVSSVNFEEITKDEQIDKKTNKINQVLENLSANNITISAENIQKLLDCNEISEFMLTTLNLQQDYVANTLDKINCQEWIFDLYTSKKLLYTDSTMNYADNNLASEIKKLFQDYTLELIPEHLKSQPPTINDYVIYLSKNTRTYITANMQEPAMLPKEIDLSNLEDKLTDYNFRKSILEVTLKAGHIHKYNWQLLKNIIYGFIELGKESLVFNSYLFTSIRFILEIMKQTGKPDVGFWFVSILYKLDSLQIAFTEQGYDYKYAIELANIYCNDNNQARNLWKLINEEKLNKDNFISMINKSKEILNDNTMNTIQKNLQIQDYINAQITELENHQERKISLV